MTYTPFEHAESLCIGTVDFVAPDEIKVALDIEAPESVAMNVGQPRPFPRVNGYMLIHVDDGYLVGQVEWITIERSPFPKRRGLQDFGLIDLPYPLRKMRVNPLGMLRATQNGQRGYLFTRGAEALPTVGASVVLPTDEQLRSIVESGERRRVKIGTSPLAGNADVRVDPDRLFGRHLAVLGNTGSGKSCSVAGLIRWSLEQAQAEGKSRPNARFIVLDPNGEYRRAFSDCASAATATVFSASSVLGSPLQVPLWFWTSEEWSAFVQASARAQRPLLKRALRDVRLGQNDTVSCSSEYLRLSLRRYLTSTVVTVRSDARMGIIRTDATKFGKRLKAISTDLENRAAQVPECDLASVLDAIGRALSSTHRTGNSKGTPFEWYDPFTEEPIGLIVEAMTRAIESLGGTITTQDGPDEDVPVPFDGADLADHLEMLAEQENVSQYVDFLVSRIRTFLSDAKIRPITCDHGVITLQEWLSEYVGDCGPEERCVNIIDLSLVPTEVIHVVTAVIARMVFEALQRYRRRNGVVLPTVLTMEEAHTFVRRYRDDTEDHGPATHCCQVFERIAREGRKFGLGLVLSSQRPSELSPTVLSQCNSFLLHRISNDRDQELVQRMVPDNLRGLLRELPTLPSQNAILMGWASELPVLVRLNDLPQHQRPHSDDPDFWDVWTGHDAEGKPVQRDVDWCAIASEWQGNEVPTKDVAP